MTQEPMRCTVNWNDKLSFEATSGSGHQFTLDGDTRKGASPMEVLLAGLAGCMAIDVVNILTKMRLDLKSLNCSVAGDRNDQPPRYYKAIHLEFRVAGEAPRDKVERAIQMSFETYCSVFHSLRKDLKVTHSLTLE